MPTTTSSSVSLQIDEEKVQELIQQYRNNLLPNLPREKWFCSESLYKYNGFWFGPDQLTGLIAFQKLFQAQDTDIVLVTPPKSGTTWLKALVFTLANRNIYPVNQNHPLFEKNPHSLIPFTDFLCSPPGKALLNPDSSSCSLVRLYATHAPIAMLQESMLNSSCKIVYLCRDPKDVFVSYWHFTTKLGSMETSFEEFFDLFCKGVSHSGPVWDHVLGYWKAHLDKPQKVLFLKYEGLKEERASQLKLLAEFIGCPISQEEEADGLIDEILRLCSFDHLKSLAVNKSGAWWIASNQSYFRKGEVGDWKNYLTSEMAERLDHITAEKFHGSGLNL